MLGTSATVIRVDNQRPVERRRRDLRVVLFAADDLDVGMVAAQRGFELAQADRIDVDGVYPALVPTASASRRVN